MKSFFDLVKDVHKLGICQQCGGCVSFCNSIEHNVIGFREPNSPPEYLNKDQCVKCGLCYLICPQTHMLEEEINETFKFSNFLSMPLGFMYNIRSCQATDEEFLEYGTDGGVVNSIINYLLEKRVIDGAIVAKTNAPFSKEAIIARNKKDLLNASGVKLNISPQLDEIQKFHTYTHSLPKLKQYQFKKLAVVGTPCQIYTIRCMENLGITPSENIELYLGLFCYENFFFDKDQVKNFEEEFNIQFEDIEKINIKEELIIHLKEGVKNRKIKIPLDDLSNYIRPACNACADFTNIYADISFGGLGSPEKHTTVISRTQKGRDIISKAIKAKVITCSTLNQSKKEKMKDLIRQYSLAKLRRKERFFQKAK